MAGSSYRRFHARPVWASRRRRNMRVRNRGYELLENRCLLAAYSWQNVAIGAGGFADGVFYDAHNQNVIYARTDIGGLYKSTNDGTTWTQLLDFVGRSTGTSGNGTQSQLIGVLGFAIDPQNSNNLYADVGEYSGTNGAVFYSTDAGQTWGKTNLSFYVGGNSNGRGNGEQIAVDPNKSNVVYLGSNDHGLWKSTDSGHSFTQISTAVFSPTSTTFVLFDPASGTPGNASQTIYVGINATGAGTNLYTTVNGGASWSQVGGTGSLPTGFLPGHAVLSGGNMYLGYANAQAPGGSFSNGGVYRYTPSTAVWANISPVATNGRFGYNAVAADPQNPNTVVAASFNFYSGPDQMWRTVNANAANPTWTALMDYSSAQNSGYGGYNNTRNTSTAPWIAPFGDGIGNWTASVAINPFNSNQLMYGNGQGIWATNNASNNGTNTKLTAPNSWYFPDAGIEFTAVIGLDTGSYGLPLFSAMGDIFGFAHNTLINSPTNGAALNFGTGISVDVAGSNPNVVVMVGSIGTNNGAYSTNNGQTFTQFAANPGGGTPYAGGWIAVSASGSNVVWAPSGRAPYLSTNNGASWVASTGGMATGGQVVADQLNANDFYYRVGSNVYFSSNGGASFTLQTSAGPTGGRMAVNPFVTGDLWIAANNGLYHSTNFGSTFTNVTSSLTSTNGVIALGAPAPGQTTPAIYLFGTINNFLGVYRSDNGGASWTLLNDAAHQWGGLLQTFAADPNVFGRLYIGVNGRGIIMGNPANSLPAGWSDADIKTPGNPGWATSSTTLSSGGVVNQWSVNGGGAGIAGTSDQFHFTSKSVSASAAISAQLTKLTNADDASGTPEAGLMMRASSNDNAPFAAVVQTAGSKLVFKYRTTTGGNVSSVSISGIPLSTEYLKLINTANSFAAFYSADGTNWTQLGASVAIAGMPATYNVGLCASANYNPQLTAAVLNQVVVNAFPTIAAAAAATPNPTDGATASMSVLAADDGGETSLNYTWTASSLPAGAQTPTFSLNNSNAAKNGSVTFYQAGTYLLQATARDAGDLSISSSIVVTVNQTLTSIVVSPATATLTTSQSETFSAVGLDQFGNPLLAQATITWSVDAGSIGNINSTGLYSAPLNVVGSAVVRASSGAVSGVSQVAVHWVKGDLDGDGQLNAADLPAFLAALTDLSVFQNRRNLTSDDVMAIADINSDNRVSNGDIQALLDLMADSGGGSRQSTVTNASATQPSGAVTRLAVPVADSGQTISESGAQPAAPQSIAVAARLSTASTIQPTFSGHGAPVDASNPFPSVANSKRLDALDGFFGRLDTQTFRRRQLSLVIDLYNPEPRRRKNMVGHLDDAS
jgi:hypothetical protein